MATKNKAIEIDENLFTSADEVPIGATAMPSTGFVIDLAAVPMVQELLPKGDYNATIVHAEPATAKDSGNPMIKIRWRIDGGAYDQRSMFDNLVFTQPTGDWNRDFPLRKIVEFCAAIGWTEHKIDPERLLGESCVISVVQKPQKRNGSTINPETGEEYPMQNSVVAYKPAGSLRTVDDLL